MGALGVITIVLVVISVWFGILTQFMESAYIYAVKTRFETGSKVYRMQEAGLVIHPNFHLGMLTKMII